MNCFECAKANELCPQSVSVGTAASVSVSITLIEASDYRLAGTTFGCPHHIPQREVAARSPRQASPLRAATTEQPVR